MSGFGSVKSLADIFREGRNLDKSSLAFVDMGGAPGIPPELYVRHIPSGQELGGFWYSDLRNIMDLAEIEGDSEDTNPNFKFLSDMFREMTKMRHGLGQPLPSPYEPKLPESLQKLGL